MRKFTVKLGLAMLLGSSVFAAGVPNTINYQGRLTDAAGDAVPDGAILVKFQIYDAATGGTVLWNSLFQTINTVDGLFSYDLGSNVALPDLFGTDSVRYLGITVGTDPEISPRSRFTSSGYVFRSQKSDLALDADSLGGLQPAFYLDWGNMTSIPAGFADGVDDEGIDQVTADGRYVLETGDTITGDLTLLSSGGINSFHLQNNPTGGKLFMGRNFQFRPMAELLGDGLPQLTLRGENKNSFVGLTCLDAGGVVRLGDSLGSSTIDLWGNRLGDYSVQLPSEAINSLEILDEPGIVQGRYFDGITLIEDNMLDLVVVTISTPAAGYVVLQGRSTFRFEGTTGMNFAYQQIDEVTGGGPSGGNYTFVGAFNYVATSRVFFDCSSQRTFFKPAGTHTFRLKGMHGPSSIGGVATSWFPTLTATYISTSYGSVVEVSEQPGDHPDAQAVSIIGPDGKTQIGYKMDLRYYEEKARVAKMAEQKAELARMEAELELAKARATSDRN